MTKEFQLTDETIVSVDYPDGKGAHEVTVSEIRERFKEENPAWLNSFLHELETRYVAYTNFGGRYKVKSYPLEIPKT